MYLIDIDEFVERSCAFIRAALHRLMYCEVVRQSESERGTSSDGTMVMYVEVMFRSGTL